MKTKQNLLPESSVFTNSDDVKFILFQQSEVISDFIRTNDYWFPSIMGICGTILEQHKEDLLESTGTVVDIGSGFGSVTVPLAIRYNDNFEFHCFEPVSFLVKQLNTNVLLNCIDNVVVHEVGLSDENKSVEFSKLDPFICGNHGSFSFAKEYDEVRNIHHSSEVANYDLKTLDSFNLKNVKLIKISCNGYEAKVLDGAKNTIAENNNPPLVIEVWNDEFYASEKQLIRGMLGDLGYEYIHALSTHLVAFKTKDEADKLNASGADLISGLTNDDELELLDLSDRTETSEDKEVLFDIVDVSHDTESTIENQTIYKQS